MRRWSPPPPSSPLRSALFWSSLGRRAGHSMLHGAIPSPWRPEARSEDTLEQTTLPIRLDRTTEPAVTLGAEERRRVTELMVAAILAVHRAADEPTGGGVDDDTE